ncbi:DUF3052 domain-containing protein [Tahibacter amnicola]|uniref:DUF3052 domain-containing protein n=1 Tax=Tahibacter amnicola TaxID=2976241 RepID=A0ABY6BJ80_9GAMM|nr:DUF3052 domain-containing protein [Tahibacter amnicola]UXI69155.1 DUF3052 domain-containing protein [Tahibacter amnicola]
MQTTSNDAGYSGKPLWQKLGLKPGLCVHLSEAVERYAQLTGFDMTQVTLARHGAPFNFGHVFVQSREALAQALAALDERLAPDGQLWISWPKKASKIATDVTEDTVRELALPRQLVDVKVCAVDATWSGLKLVRRKSAR